MTAVVLSTGAALLALSWDGEPRHAAGWATSLALGLLLAWSGRLQVHVRHRGTTEASDLFDVSLTVCAVAFSAPELVAVALAAKAVSQAMERVEPRKAAFNVATAGASAAAMALTLSLLDGAPLLLALPVAQLAAWLVNHLALLAVLAAAGLRREVVHAGAVSRWAVQGVVSAVLGLLLALAWIQSPVAVVLFVVPLAALHHAGRALNRAAAERRRLAGTAAASRELSSGSVEDLPAYLEHLRAAFGAQAAHLRTEPEISPPLTVGGALGAAVRSWLDGLEAVLPPEQPERLRLELPDKVEVLAVRLPGSPGVLALIDPRGERDSSSAELATTAAAAREISSFLDAQGVRRLAAQEHERLEEVIRSVADGIITVSADARLLSFNSAAAEITGLCAEQALHHHVELLGLIGADGRAWDPTENLDARLSGVRLQLRTTQGLLRHVDVSSSPALVDGQQCAVLVLRDVTARVEQESARQRFVIGLGHELRTPLTPLLGWARTLRRRPDLLDDQPQREHMVHALDTESARLARLVDNLLTAVDPGAVIAQRTSVDLADLVQSQLRRARPELSGRTVTIATEGSTQIVTNVRAVSQIVDNLLSNVARYTPAGSSVRIQVVVGEGAAVIEVVDTGPGVPETQREEIFGLFVRGDGEAANPGVGMGLAVSRSLARSLGGDLHCVDPPPSLGDEPPGAAFRVMLPVQVARRQPQTGVVSQLFSA